MDYKIDPVYMADIFFDAKQDFLERYKDIFTEKQYDDMITKYFKANYTWKEMEDSFDYLEDAEPALQKAHGYSEYIVSFSVTVPDKIMEEEKIKSYIKEKIPYNIHDDRFVFKKTDEITDRH